MTNFRSNQKGIAHLGLLLLVVVVAAAGAVAYRVHQSSTSTSTASITAKVPAKISTTADLTKASAALDATNIDSVNPNSLDSDLNSLL
ncbi:MAG TPA: hypothetical protein VLG13_02160 [Patescibacteria group bacterium]|nr:hypothetical protein [Patescibacteria group bacterium]